MINPDGLTYEFTEPKYVKIVVVDEDREIVYWFKHSTKGKGWYLNSQSPEGIN